MEQHEIKSSPNVEATAQEIVDTAALAPSGEEVLQRVSVVAAELRKIILEVKKLPRDKTLEPHLEEMRCLAQAQTQLQTGLMWLRRSINPTKEF